MGIRGLSSFLRTFTNSDGAQAHTTVDNVAVDAASSDREAAVIIDGNSFIYFLQSGHGDEKGFDDTPIKGDFDSAWSEARARFRASIITLDIDKRKDTTPGPPQ